MKGYKGFSKGLICRGKQYAENTVFEEDSAEICHSGMHFCKNPYDVLDYYGFVDDSGECVDYVYDEYTDSKDYQTEYFKATYDGKYRYISRGKRVILGGEEFFTEDDDRNDDSFVRLKEGDDNGQD